MNGNILEKHFPGKRVSFHRLSGEAFLCPTVRKIGHNHSYQDLLVRIEAISSSSWMINVVICRYSSARYSERAQ
jgi:hypothetical protein